MEKLTELNFADQAEQVINEFVIKDKHGKESIKKPSNSQIRNLLELTTNLYNHARKEKTDVLSTDIQSDVQYVKMKFAYAAGRNKDVKNFVEKADLINRISMIKDSKAELMLFCKYMESLVAYHRFHGGSDR